MKFNAKQQELKRYNFRSAPDSKLAVSADSIPTLVPAEALKAFGFAEDLAPYFKIEAIEFPTKANGYTYTEEFWRSFVGKMNERPIPGSRYGHDMRWGARGPTDLLLIGGRVDSKGGGAGTVYLKNYIPPKGESGDNGVFIAMNKAGMVDYSIVSYTRDEITTLPEGNREYKCIESLGGERNDAVDFGTGAMDMKTNAEGQKLNSKCVTFAKSCIASGKVDASSAWSFSGSDGDSLLGTNGDDWANYAKYHLVEDQGATEDTKARWKYPVGKAGKIYRTALRAVASRAAQQNLQDVSDAASKLMSEIDKKEKGNSVDKEELLKTLGVMKANAQVTLAEVAKAMGLEGQLVTSEHVEAVRVINALKADGVTDPISVIKAAKEREKADAIIVRNAALDVAFGTKGEKNLLRSYAEKQVGDVGGEELAKRINALKEDPVALKLAADKADYTTDTNTIGRADHKGDAPTAERRVDKM